MSGAQLGWAVEAMIASTLLMALVLLARRHVRQAFGPQIAYALWALPLLRLILPPLPRGLSEQATPPLAAASESFTTDVVLPMTARMTSQLPATADTPSIWPMVEQGIALFWIVGAAGFLGFQALRHWRFRTRLLADAETLDAVEGVRVVASDGAPGPLAFGIWRRYVAFPRDFAERYDADERDLALAHELGHHARGDLIANWIALAVLALHWFNPLAWRAFHAFRADQELANDASVLRGRSRADRHVYACAIVKAAHGRALSGACHLHTIDDLKGRLKMLTTSPKSRRQLAMGGATVSLLVLAGLGATASGTPAAAALTRKVERTLGVDLTSTVAVLPAVAQTAPEAPEAPAAPSVPAVPAAPAKPVVAVAATAPAVPAVPAAPSTVEPPAAPQAPATPRVRVVTLRSGDKVRIVGNEGIVPMPPMPPIPMVQARSCGTASSDTRTSYTTVDGKTQRQVTIICTDRIERDASHASLAAFQAQRSAQMNMRIALSSIESARASITRDRNLSEDARRDALKGLDEATAELKAEMASRDRD
ncbi:M56 family metallopeptidase [uncultured Sphingomonas sp.]|uniref:M56 family metallopeptidase n=1 Tax=uncultured Sphingomonas sp. TaxID=158754 RepID=UPI0025D3390F|nr:M56 family metallopeptidase [uncultured Sphingomonas sp.]